MDLERSLAGTWQFQIDPTGTLTVADLSPDRQITVPLPWQAAFPDLQQYSGYAWYRRTFDLDETWLETGLEVLLKFGAVDYWCEVYVNGQRVGEHEGGYTPFVFPIRQVVRAGQNELCVRVYDPVQDQIAIPRWPDYHHSDSATRPPFDSQGLPHGKQEWYINVGGIWQNVLLAAVPQTHIDSVRITPNIHTGQVEVDLNLGGDLTMPSGILRLTVQPTDENTIESEPLALVKDQTVYTLRLTVPTPRLWSPETPNLYSATITLQQDGLHQDRKIIRFGFREITTHEGQLLLNGEPIYLLAALDQDFYADTIYTVPSEAYLRDEFHKAKALGLNCLRCHIKVPDPLYLDLADELGLLVWQEIPSWRTFYVKAPLHPHQLDLSDLIKARAAAILEAMITRDYNHPALVIWTIVNEDWGTALALSEPDRAWVAAMYDTCKRLDPTRLVVDNSACPNGWGPNVHVKSDLEDFHVYTNIPDQARGFVEMVEQLGQRPLWTYSTHGDAQRTGQEPIILSEFGNWGLPSLNTLRHSQGGEIPWADLGAWWSPWEGAPGWPRGAEARFDQLGLAAIWPTYDAFATATQQHQFAALKYEIETLRRQPTITGYVITELADIYWESNGLLDFYRNPKVYHRQFAAFNSPDMIAPQPERYAYWDDQAVQISVHGSHYASTDWTDARLRGTHKDTMPLDSAVARGTVQNLGERQFTLSPVDRATSVTIQLSLESASGQNLAESNVDLLVLPASARRATYQGQIAALLGRIPSTAAPAQFTQPLRQFGYLAEAQLTPQTQVILTDHPTIEMLRYVREGGKMLYLSAGPGPFFWHQNRGGTYSGSWITSFSWLRPGVYRRLDVANPLTLPFLNVMPTGTIVGLPFEDKSIQGDFLAGQISGWVHHPAVHTVQFRYGQGCVIMTTFNLRDTVLSGLDDPVAVAMLHDLIDHLVICQPVLSAHLGR
jgi:hypothetical protein